MKYSALIAGFAVALLAPRAFAQCEGRTDQAVMHETRTFSGGSQWTFDVKFNGCAGLIFSQVFFKPAGGVARLVLNRANAIEVHVPYLKGTPRFLDGSATGFGGAALQLSPQECEGGTLVPFPTTDPSNFCIRNADGGYAWKFEDEFRRAEAIELFQSSQFGLYNYINAWTFKSDGSIEVRFGLTGSLQETAAGSRYLPYGARLNPESEPDPIVAISHVHAVYYRLDFDLDGPGNDLVSRRVFTPSTSPSPDDTGAANSCSVAGTCGTVSFVPITTEAAHTISVAKQNSWVIEDKTTRNADGRRIGYELIPHLTGIWHGRTTADEPWSGDELWVTAFNRCELNVVGNVVGAADGRSPLPADCGTPARNLQAMVNGQSTDGKNIVVWYANRLLHHPRDEDGSRMAIEWMSFELAPRNFFHDDVIDVPGTVRPAGGQRHPHVPVPLSGTP
jgi:primary-amine oxidase